MYGPPVENLSLAANLIGSYRTARTLSEAKIPNEDAHDQAMELLLLKVARIATGRLHADNYDDVIGYATLAKEVSKCD